MGNFEYSGRDNLDVMQRAVNYNKYLLNLIIADAQKGDCLVDFGAGNGTFSYPLVAAGYRVTCVETDPVLSAGLARRGMIVFTDLEEAEDCSIDYIYSLNVLEHIEDDNAILALWSRKLRLGGKVLVYVPAFQALYSSMDRKVGHVRRYSKQELLRKLSEAGFCVSETRYADSAGFFASLLFKFLDKGDGTVNLKMLEVYDRWVFPFSLVVDVFANRFWGKNVYARAIKPARMDSESALRCH